LIKLSSTILPNGEIIGLRRKGKCDFRRKLEKSKALSQKVGKSKALSQKPKAAIRVA
jgi:hypothetical protein